MKATDTMHAVMVIDMDEATAEEIRCVVREVRHSAALSGCDGWPDDLAVLVGRPADEVCALVANAVSEHRGLVSV